MSRMKQFLTNTAALHTSLAKAHQAAGSDCEEGSSAAAFHEDCMKAHTTFAEGCVDMAKSESDELGKSDVMPTRVSAVNPSPQPRPVFRTGQRDFNGAGAGEMPPNVPSIYQKIFAQEPEE